MKAAQEERSGMPSICFANAEVATNGMGKTASFPVLKARSLLEASVNAQPTPISRTEDVSLILNALNIRSGMAPLAGPHLVLLARSGMEINAPMTSPTVPLVLSGMAALALQQPTDALKEPVGTGSCVSQIALNALPALSGLGPLVSLSQVDALPS